MTNARTSPHNTAQLARYFLQKLMFGWTFYTARWAKLQSDHGLGCHKWASHNCTERMITISYETQRCIENSIDIMNFACDKSFFFSSKTSQCVCNMTPCLPVIIYDAGVLREQDRCKQSAVVLRLAGRHKPPPTDQKGEWRLPILGH